MTPLREHPVPLLCQKHHTDFGQEWSRIFFKRNEGDMGKFIIGVDYP